MTGLELKTAAVAEVVDTARGEISAVLAVTRDARGKPTIDADGDAYGPDAFEHGQSVILGPYGHATPLRGAPPLGKGRLVVNGPQVEFHGAYFMSLPAARDEFELVRLLGPEQQWSFHLHPLLERPGRNGARRHLEKVRVTEVSPVYQGASVGSRTITAKSADDLFLDEWLKFMRRKWAS